jgi:hypothetical protein
MGCNVTEIAVQEVHGYMATPGRPTVLPMPPSIPVSYCPGWRRVKELKNVPNDGKYDSLSLKPPPAIVLDCPSPHELPFRQLRRVEVAHEDMFKGHFEWSGFDGGQGKGV